jgi:hypothetical protein
MQDGRPKPRHKLYGGIAVSVALHAIIAAALFVRLPAAEPAPPEEETVSVEMVAPPEEQQAEPEAEEQEQALNLAMPEPEQQQEQQQMPPPPEPPQQEADEAGGEPPPAGAESEEVAEEAQAQPPQPEQPAEQQAETEEQPPEEPAAPEQQAQAEPPPPPPPAQEQATPDQQADQQAEQQASAPSGQEEAGGGQDEVAEARSLPVLRPVFEFGEEDSGPRVSDEGNASEETEAADSQAEATEAETAPDGSEQTASEADSAEETQATPPALSLPPDIALPTVDTAATDPLPASEDSATDGVQAEFAPESAPRSADEGLGDRPQTASGKPLKEARQLFSFQDNGDPLARMSMEGIPPEIRVRQLCWTELRAQLRHGSPAFEPEILPSPHPVGTVVDVDQAAFGAGGQWYDLRYRCEVDKTAMKVVSFGIDVGNAVPRSQWRERGLPEY